MESKKFETHFWIKFNQFRQHIKARLKSLGGKIIVNYAVLKRKKKKEERGKKEEAVNRKEGEKNQLEQLPVDCERDYIQIYHGLLSNKSTFFIPASSSRERFNNTAKPKTNVQINCFFLENGINHVYH